MNQLRILLFAGGGAILALIGGLYLAIARQRKQHAALALELLRQGASQSQAQALLVSRGMDSADAAEAVQAAIRGSAAEAVEAILEKGASEDDAVRKLAASGVDAKVAEDVAGLVAFNRWFRRHPVLYTLVGLVLSLVGIAVCFAGLVLRDGNLSGKFMTFPYAGSITITAGICITAAGCMFLSGHFVGFRRGKKPDPFANL
jgi:hypothetical protein